MPLLDRFADLHDDIVSWRHDYHRHPELLYDVHRTAADVAQKLRSFGCDEVVEGVGRTGVVGVVKGQGAGAGGSRTIGLRAEMDALPIAEESGKPWMSEHPGKMHACGHDGHTAMLLGTARYLVEGRSFSGTAVLIFQPAEEGGAGGRAMVEDGLMDRFGIEEVYGLHNMPSLPIGQFAIRPGAFTAASDRFVLDIEGYGGHAARPHTTVDPIVAGSAIVQALQSVVARNVDPLSSAVISLTTFNAGNAHNVTPQSARITGTVRSLEPSVRDLLERRMTEVVVNVAAAHQARAILDYRRNYPMTINHGESTAKAAAVARELVGDANVDDDHPPVLGGEDFSFMLEARPGALIFMGNGNTADLHHPAYDFDDSAISYGCSFWGRLVEKLMPAT